MELDLIVKKILLTHKYKIGSRRRRKWDAEELGRMALNLTMQCSEIYEDILQNITKNLKRKCLSPGEV